ncbi:MAG: hypothetical protein U0892_15190 [Pirellulales bacterium]
MIPCAESSAVFRLPMVSMPIVMADDKVFPYGAAKRNASVLRAGVIASPRTEHVFAFDAKSGSLWRFECAARELGSPLDATVMILAADDKVLSTQDDKGPNVDPSFEWKVLRLIRTYRLVVRDTFRHGTSMHFYRLIVSAVQPEFRASFSSDDRGNGRQADRNEIAIDRSGSFDEDLEVRIVDAAGVSA